MTSIVGVLCQDGVVIGTDSAATFGGRTRTIEQSTEKLDLIGGELVLAGVGSTGLRQRFRDLVEDAWKRDLFKKSRAIELGKYFASNAIQDLARRERRREPLAPCSPFLVRVNPSSVLSIPSTFNRN